MCARSLAIIGAIVFGTTTLLLVLVSGPEGRDLPPQILFAQTDAVTVRPGAAPVYGLGTVRPRDEVCLVDAKLVLLRTEVKAPFAGFVRDGSVAVGRLFAAAIEGDVSLSHANAVLIPGLWELHGRGGDSRVGTRVVARHGETGYSWEGYVDWGEVSLDEQTRTVDGVVRIPDPLSVGVAVERPDLAGGTPPLLVGEFVGVMIEGVSPDRYFRAPLQPGNEVWDVIDGGVVSIVSVHILQRADDEVFLTGALWGGQVVITGGLQFATEGVHAQTGTDLV